MNKRNSFITGALILIAANTISKILGAVFKIPLTYILHEDGMAMYNTAFQAYAAVMSLSTAGFVFAGSKIIAERTALSDKAGVFRTVAWLAAILSVFGLAGTALLYFGADFFAAALHEPSAAYGIQMLAPSVFFVAIGIAFKSYYQGSSSMLPPAISQVTEAAVKLILGYKLASMFAYSAGLCTAYSLLGVTIGEILATFLLFLMYLPCRMGKLNAPPAVTRVQTVRAILSITIPLLLISAVSNALSLADTAIIRKALVSADFSPSQSEFFKTVFPSFTDIYTELADSGSLSELSAGKLYGAYTGYALTVFHLPLGITGTFSVSVLPLIAGALATNDLKSARRHTQTAFCVTMLFAVPAAVCVFVMSEELLTLLFKNPVSAPMLSAIAPGIIFLAAEGLAVSVMQTAGKLAAPFYVMLFTYAVKFAGNFFLIQIPELNILGAVLSSDICFFCSMCINLFILFRKTGLKISMADIIIKPLISGAAMLLVMLLAKSSITALTVHVFFKICILGGLGAAVFFLTFLLIDKKHVR